MSLYYLSNICLLVVLQIFFILLSSKISSVMKKSMSHLEKRIILTNLGENINNDLVRTVEDFVEEDGEVESQAEPDGVGGLHAGLGNVEGVLVGLLAVLNHRLLVASDGHFRQVSQEVKCLLDFFHLFINIMR